MSTDDNALPGRGLRQAARSLGRIVPAPENFLTNAGKGRRGLLGGMLGGGAALLGAKARGQAGATQNGAAPSVPAWSKILGQPVNTTYGVPSAFEKNIVRRQSPGLTTTNQSSVAFTPLQNLFGIITPSGLHFERDHNGRPDIDPYQHPLMIHGLVREPKTFTMEDILRFPSVSRIHFIECGVNTAMEWGNVAVPTVQYSHGMLACSEYTGVLLSTLLDEVGVDRHGAKFILAEGADGASLTRTISLEIALNDVMVVYGQNGDMLRPENGYPLRLLVPGVQGVSNVKWLRCIKVGDQPFETREETRQYSDFMPSGISREYTWIQEAKSVITSPSGGQKLLDKGVLPDHGTRLIRARPGEARRCISRRGAQLAKGRTPRTGVDKGAHTISARLALGRGSGAAAKPRG